MYVLYVGPAGGNRGAGLPSTPVSSLSPGPAAADTVGEDRRVLALRRKAEEAAAAPVWVRARLLPATPRGANNFEAVARCRCRLEKELLGGAARAPAGSAIGWKSNMPATCEFGCVLMCDARGVKG